MLTFISLFFARFSTRLNRWAGLFLTCLLIGTSVFAQSSTVTTPQVKAELLAYAPDGVQAGHTFWLGLRLQHQPQWHTYWRNPGDSGLPTDMRWDLPAGLDVGEVLWPLPHQLKAGALTNYGFDGETLLVVPVQVASLFKPGLSPSVKVQMHANWLVCRQECIPQEGDFELTLPLHSSTALDAAAFENVLAQQPTVSATIQASARVQAASTAALTLEVRGLPAKLRQQPLEVFAQTPEVLASASLEHPQASQHWEGETWIAQLPLHALRQTAPSQLTLLLVSNNPTRAGWQINVPVAGTWPDPQDSDPVAVSLPEPVNNAISPAGMALALLGALIGGLILNLMPCVLPVLAIKLLGFAQHHESAHQHRRQGLAYTLGVVLSFLALGSLLLILRASGEQLGWGFQLQSPFMVMALACLFTLIALSLFGLFEAGQLLPSRWTSYQAHHPVVNAFVSGVLAVVVASPCTAPFMGASLGLAVTLPAWMGLLIFATMGLGLALPYALISWWPGLSRFVPRPGAWMVTLRQFFGFPMLATVLWLLWVFALQTDLTTSLWVWMCLLSLSAALWAIRLRSPLGKALRWGLGLLALALGVLSVESVHPMSSASPITTNSSAPASLQWQGWTPQAVAQDVAQQKPVFVDFTAAWCVTCQINKHTTLSNAQVIAAFQAKHVQLYRADWTRRDPQITQALTQLGRSGVPVYVFYRPHQPPVVLSELLSVEQVMQTLDSLP